MTPRPPKTGIKVFVDHNTALALGDEDKTPANFNNSLDMKDPCEDYEKAGSQIHEGNAQLLDAFVIMLREHRLEPGTIRKHRENVDFFINEFLLYQETKKPEEGIDDIDELTAILPQSPLILQLHRHGTERGKVHQRPRTRRRIVDLGWADEPRRAPYRRHWEQKSEDGEQKPEDGSHRHALRCSKFVTVHVWGRPPVCRWSLDIVRGPPS